MTFFTGLPGDLALLMRHPHGEYLVQISNVPLECFGKADCAIWWQLYANVTEMVYLSTIYSRYFHELSTGIF